MGTLTRAAAVAVTTCSLFSSIVGLGAPVQAVPADACRQVPLNGETPVLFVHGWTGSPQSWSKKADSALSLPDAVRRLPDVKVVTPFDYQKWNRNWVTDRHIGPALAQRIACLADYSQEADGPSEVIVIAHSMGGLAARHAADLEIDDTPVAAMIAQVITIGTPHLGSTYWKVGGGVADWLRPGQDGSKGAAGPLMWKSKEVMNLPHFPEELPVFAIAGDITTATPAHTVKNRGGTQKVPLKKQRTYSDGVVLQVSAQDEYSAFSTGGGLYTARCERIIGSRTPPPCEHSQLMGSKAVQDQVVRAIQRYLAYRDRDDDHEEDGV